MTDPRRINPEHPSVAGRSSAATGVREPWPVPLGAADCCPAQARFRAVLPPAPRHAQEHDHGRDHSVELLLCAHHARANRAALAGAGAEVYDEWGLPVL